MNNFNNLSMGLTHSEKKQLKFLNYLMADALGRRKILRLYSSCTQLLTSNTSPYPPSHPFHFSTAGDSPHKTRN